MNKASEKELYESFVDACPRESYLRDVLTQSRDFVFGNIDNDIAWPLYETARVLSREIAEGEAKLTAVKQELAAAVADLRTLQHQKNQAEFERRAAATQTAEWLDAMSEARTRLRSLLAGAK